jgi:hypothetical protein
LGHSVQFLLNLDAQLASATRGFLAERTELNPESGADSLTTITAIPQDEDLEHNDQNQADGDSDLNCLCHIPSASKSLMGMTGKKVQSQVSHRDGTLARHANAYDVEICDYH